MSGPGSPPRAAPGSSGTVARRADSERTALGTEPWAFLPAEQQPVWRDHPAYAPVRARLAELPPLVTPAELREVHAALADVARGEALLLQSGDCAEVLAEATGPHVRAKADLLGLLAGRLDGPDGRPVIQMGRLGGQYAKPRSSPVERHGDVDLPVFRGPMVNGPEPVAAARRHDPRRMLRAYDASRQVLGRLAELRHSRAGPWAAHESLVLDYEGPAIRPDPVSGGHFLGSTHMPWIGERTRRPDGAHVHMLAAVTNPVAVKLGPRARVADVLRLCRALDPDRRPGRLTLIVRMGVRHIAEALPQLVTAVQRAGHPVIWVSDPMHGNTRKTATGVKTRLLSEISAEALQFRHILQSIGRHPGGLHLEVTPDPVTECVGAWVSGQKDVPRHYLSSCDPRLNPEQAIELIDAWR
jgi:3-deoxy-7-phosphoheptulonate synthase